MICEEGCGCCWAFSAVGVAEGFLRKKISNLTLSAQQLVDCATINCWGCNSGWPKYAIDYLIQNGMATSNSYPYIAQQKKCTFTASMSVKPGNIKASVEIPTRGNFAITK